MKLFYVANESCVDQTSYNVNRSWAYARQIILSRKKLDLSLAFERCLFALIFLGRVPLTNTAMHSFYNFHYDPFVGEPNALNHLS